MSKGVGTVRRAGPRDLDGLLALRADFAAVDGHPHDVPSVRRALEPLLEDDALGQVWLIEQPGQPDAPVGFAVVTWSWSIESGGRDCILDEIFVRDRGRGLGSALLEAAMEGARAVGAAAMFLETEAPNARVRGFYERGGFTAEDSMWMQRPL